MKNVLRTCSSYVSTITVGVANYIDTPAASMPVDVYGKIGETEVYLTTVDVATSPATVGSTFFTKETYTGFTLKYNKGNRLNANFHANEVTCRIYMKQADDTTVSEGVLESLAREVTNLSRVTMAYDIGTSEPDVFCLTSTTTTLADDELILPSASLVKTVWITDNITKQERALRADESLYPSQVLTYKITFTNEDENNTGLSIPMPFLADAIPSELDLYDEDGNLLGISVTKNGSSIYIGDTIISEGFVVVDTLRNSEMKPGDSITLSIKASVKNNVLMSAGIQNTAFSGSTTVLDKSATNPYGSPFRSDKKGNYPLEIVNRNGIPYSEFKEYRTIKATVDTPVSYNSNLSIVKSVAADKTGPDAWYEGYTSSAEAYGRGDVWYRIDVHSSTPIAAGKLRLMDKLPAVGETSIGLSNPRRSGFGLTWKGDFKITIGNTVLTEGKDFVVSFTNTPEVKTSTVDGVTYTNYLTALKGGFSAGNLTSCSASEALAFMVDFKVTIPANTNVRITYTCTAPDYLYLDTNNQYSYNLGKLAVNDATLWYQGFNTEVNPTQTSRSNRTQVTINTADKAAIGQRIWIDTNANGLRDEGEQLYTDSEIKLSLLTYYNIRNNPITTIQRTSTGTYRFGNLYTGILQYAYRDTPVTSVYNKNGNINKSMLNGLEYYTYRVSVDENDIPAGYVVTKAYAGNNGNPTVLDVKEADNHILYYDPDARDGHLVDSDFRRNGTKFQTTQIYLPLQKDLSSN